MSESTVLIYSGGMDSTTLLYFLRSREYELKALGVNYGQRHIKELAAAETICRRLGIDLQLADLSNLKPLLQGSSLTSPEVSVPEGYYTDETMKQTIVPNRNMLLLAAAIAWAVSLNYESVAYAAHAGDHAIYPDCRPQFVEAMSRAAELAHYRPIRLLSPFIHMTKAEIVRTGHHLNVPFELTWSCYQGEDLHCGRCGTCSERAEAFALADVPDPTRYARAPQFPHAPEPKS